ncbi:aldehyde dehydrogenase family protein [Brucella gallinifaecis]|uniref:aldehyde dehydrogenase family protein n=1 Tax=Brucella gallinifaecis TaxID=215590 RepID=UPI00387EB125
MPYRNDLSLLGPHVSTNGTGTRARLGSRSSIPRRTSSARGSPRCNGPLGGSRHELVGQFCEPTLITGVTSEVKIAREGAFVPVAPLFAFDSLENVIERANHSDTVLLIFLYAGLSRLEVCRRPRVLDDWR